MAEHYDKNGLTRAGMEAAIARGGSVLIRRPDARPLLVKRVEDLPSAADLAAMSGDVDAQNAAARALEDRIAADQAALAKLRQRPRAPETAPPAEDMGGGVNVGTVEEADSADDAETQPKKAGKK